MKKCTSQSFILTKIQLSAVICFIGVFITGTVLRQRLYSIDYLQKYSPLMLLGILLIASNTRGRKKDIAQKCINRRVLSVYLLLLVFCITISLLSGNFYSYFSLNLFLMVPTLITIFQFRDSKEFVTVLKLWVIFFRICIFIMFIGSLIDIVTNMSITKFIADYSGVASLTRMYRQGRSVTYMGHALFSGELYLAYYCFENIWAKVEEKKVGNGAFLVALIGIALTQARAAFVLLLVLYVLLNFRAGKIKNIVLMLLVGLFVYELGFLDGIIDRIMFGIVNGDISSGRNTSVKTLILNGQLKIKYFSGHSGYDGGNVLLNMALEYPIIAWAYSYGIIVTVLQCIILFVYPMYLFIKRKQKELIVIDLVLMLCVNSYAGLTTTGMQPFFYYIALCLLVNTSNYFELKRIEQTSWESCNAKKKIFL